VTTAIPDGFTLYDWMELHGFAWKVENEGYEYASENYAPEFETPALKAIAEDDDPRPLRNLYREQYPALEAWNKAVGYEEIDRLWSAHLREEKERREAHKLWAVHPGGDWNYAAYSDAFDTREEVDDWIARQAELVTKHGWKPWTGHILHRDTPGGAWTRVPAAPGGAR
jgi:hypothetical protein